MHAAKPGIVFAFALGAFMPARGGEAVIFAQPWLGGIPGHFCVRCNFLAGTFYMVQWEDNPLTPGHGDVPVSWDMGALTGLHVPSSSRSSQVGIRNTGRTSGAQIYGDAVGAYIASGDIDPRAPGHKFIITPNIRFSQSIAPFADAGPFSHVAVSYDLQVPAARDGGVAGSATYVVSDLTFRDLTSGNSISVNQTAFRNGSKDAGDWVFYDADSSMAVVLGAGVGRSKFSTPAAGTEPVQVAPWRGWKHFSYQVSSVNLRAALDAVGSKYPALAISKEPRNWRLVGWHLNAELLFQSAPAEMGWSLRHTVISVGSGAAARPISGH